MSGGLDVVRGIGKLRAVVAVVVLLGASVGGAYAVGLVGMPSVAGVENRFAAVDDETTTIETELEVRNPNFFSVGLGGVSVNYTVELNGVRFADGRKEGVNLSTGNATLPFRTVMSNEQIPPWWTAHIRDGESSDLVVHATVHSSTLGRSVELTPVNREVSTDLLSSFDSTETRPVNADQPVVSDPVLYVNETSAEWGEVSSAETPIEMAFTVYNPKTTPYVVEAIGYDITMNGVPVGDGEIQKGAAIPPKTERTVEVETVVRNEELDAWWVSHLERNQVTDLRIDFYAKLDLGAVGTVRVPLDALTYTETIETDIFGNKEESGGGASGTAAPGGTDDATTADPTATEDGGSTTTDGGLVPTPTEEPTTTSTSTTTDDGLLG
jgi:LEA14-like dessication related protein